MKHILIVILISIVALLNGQNTLSISGFIKETNSLEPLVGVVIVSHPDNKFLTHSEANGYYRINFSSEADSILFSLIGHKDIYISYTDLENAQGQVFLTEGLELKEVVVTGRNPSKINEHKLGVEQLFSTPTIGSRPDIIKVFQTLPSVNSANEGSSLLLVRGGNPGENLYLLDDVPIIYINHLGGFMSVFNPDMISSARIFKGGFPASYGGKLSSVVDIVQREGSKTEWKGTLGIGLTDASFSVEGPIIKEKLSMLITGRKTLTDPLMKLAYRISGEDFSFAYGFHDINSKITYTPNNKNTFTFNLYQGDDYFTVTSNSGGGSSSYESRFRNLWGNWMASSSWRSLLSSRTFTYHNVSFNRYRLNTNSFLRTREDQVVEDIEFDYHSSLQNFRYKGGVKTQFTPAWNINSGIEYISNQFIPNRINTSESYDQIFTHDVGLFVENQITSIRNFEVNLGARLQMYTNSEYFKMILEPRLHTTWLLPKNQSLAIAYHRQSQGAHLLFTGGQVGNSEIWIPANQDQPASISNQISIGYKREIPGLRWIYEINVYYRDLSDLTLYREGFNTVQGDPKWREKLISGVSGNAYGIELSAEKSWDRTQGVLNYAYGRSFRKSTNINNGHEFPFEFDRPHTLTVSISHSISKKLKLNLMWNLQSGLPFTPVVGRHYSMDLFDLYGNESPELFEAWVYGSRNSDRMRTYHRLDASLQYTTLTRKRKRKAEWTFSIYNLYNRQNPYFYFYHSPQASNQSFVPFDFGNRPLGLYQVSFLPIIPSFSYRITFDKSATPREKKSFKDFMSW